MSRFNSSIVIAIVLALITQAHAAVCTVSTTSAEAPVGGSLSATWDAEGERIWDCEAGALVDPDQINGKANMTGDGYTGGFVYIEKDGKKIARFSATKDGETYTFELSPTPVLTPKNGTIADALWEVEWVGAAPEAIAGGDAYLTRSDSTGGVTPTECPNKDSNTVTVPYTTTYKLYTCAPAPAPAPTPAPAPAPSSAVARGVSAVVAAVGVVAALF